VTIPNVREWSEGAGMPKILIADDSIAVRKVAERLLTEVGLNVTLAANGEEALAFLTKERPDVVVSDVIMPDKSGYEVCAFVRGDPTLSATPVLLISGIVNDEVTRQAESCRADGVLKKPFQGTSLKDRVLELIAKRQGPTAADVMGAAHIPAATPGENTMPMPDRPHHNLRPEVGNIKDLEEQLRKERLRAEELTKRLSEFTEQLAQAKESEAQLAIERKRVIDLEETLAKTEQQASRVSELESALKAEQDAVSAFKQEAVNWKKASGRIAELESALHADRAAAEQLVQQLADLEQISIKASDLEAKLANREQQVAELHQRVHDLEAELMAERQKCEEAMGHLQELRQVSTKVQEMEELLAAERDRNGMLTGRVAEAEQAAESATKRLEEMARKLSEIAGLASQLGHGRGQS
jgi:CheY-like chemotaxis protein